MEEQNKRKTLILTIIAVLTLLILIGGATFAYFQAQVGTGDKAGVTVKAGTTDDLSFSLKDLDASKEKVSDNDDTIPIVIEPNQTNFASGENSIADGVTGTATLIANDKNYSATKTYNVYLNIKKNELQYTSYVKKQPDETPENVLSFKDEKTKKEASLEDYNPRPELYLTIKKNGEEVKTGVTINDKALSYTSDVFTEEENQLGGFDITEAKGLIKIEVPATISVDGDAQNHTETDTWEITVTFMNLETDQYLNTGKIVKGEVLIQSEEYVSQDVKTLNQLLADANKDEEITLYHHDGSILLPSTIPDLEDESIIGGYKITSEYADRYQKVSINSYNEDLQETHLIKFICDNEESSTDDYGYCDSYYFYLDYAPEKQYDTYKKALQQAIDDKYVEPDIVDANDDSYRYAGSFEEVKNYICLDGGATTTGACESDNDLYRIIGLFKNEEDKYEMKLIKYDYATSAQLGETGAYKGIYFEDSDYKGNKDNLTNIGAYYWTKSSNRVNEWVGSALRETNLNEYYINTYLKETKHIDVDNLITNHIWSLNGHDDSKVTPKVMYDNEMDKVESSPEYPTKTKTIENKIGLMYVSDYGYAASPSITNNWTISMDDGYDNITVTNNNWMYMGLNEWTISRDSSSGGRDSYAFLVYSFGGVNSNDHDVGTDADGIRPSFYLTSDAKISEGEGSKEKPYRISFE